jgi:hypothetical protein
MDNVEAVKESMGMGISNPPVLSGSAANGSYPAAASMATVEPVVVGIIKTPVVVVSAPGTYPAAAGAPAGGRTWLLQRPPASYDSCADVATAACVASCLCAPAQLKSCSVSFGLTARAAA